MSRARGTSAAPTFFKPFVNSRTKEGYLDGAVFHNNPVRIANYESKLIWPDSEELHPDILLSIGTGHDGSDTEGYIDMNRSDRRRFQIRTMFNKEGTRLRKKSSNAALKAFPEVNGLLNIFKKRVESILDPELIWREFLQDVVGTSSPIQGQRYCRVNPKISFPTPKMDSKNQIHPLYEDVRQRLHTQGLRAKISVIAHRLVSSSFYFEKAGLTREVDDHYIIQGAYIMNMKGDLWNCFLSSL